MCWAATSLSLICSDLVFLFFLLKWFVLSPEGKWSQPAVSCQVVVCDAGPSRRLVVRDVGCYQGAGVEAYMSDRVPAAATRNTIHENPCALSLALSVVERGTQGNLTCCASPTASLSSSAPTRTPTPHPHRSRSSSRPPVPPWRPDGGRRARPQRRQPAGRRPWPWITAERNTITLLETSNLSDVWVDNHD